MVAVDDKKHQVDEKDVWWKVWKKKCRNNFY